MVVGLFDPLYEGIEFQGATNSTLGIDITVKTEATMEETS